MNDQLTTNVRVNSYCFLRQPALAYSKETMHQLDNLIITNRPNTSYQCPTQQSEITAVSLNNGAMNHPAQHALSHDWQIISSLGSIFAWQLLVLALQAPLCVVPLKFWCFEGSSKISLHLLKHVEVMITKNVLLIHMQIQMLQIFSNILHRW